MIRSILFFGHYPNPIECNLNVFYRNLVYQFADMGIKCTVIDPVSVTRYREKITEIPELRIEKTKEGSEVTVISPKYISFSSRKMGPVDTHVWTVKAYRKAAVRQVEKYHLEFDAVYGHFINIGGIPACIVGKAYNRPSFVANGESDLNPETYNYSSKYALQPFHSCSGVISVSTKNKAELVNLHLVDEGIIRVFPNAVDRSLFHVLDKKECRRQLGIPSDSVIAGFVGGFSERKGDKRFLEAAKGIDGLKIAFAGAGSRSPKGDHVVFCQSVIHDMIPVFLNACDFFVLPTLNEGCCNAIIEAMACGLPVISSNLPFNDDVLNENNSLRIDPESIEEIRSAVEQLAGNAELRERLSAGALKTAASLNIEDRALKILKFMQSIRMGDNNAH